MIITSQYGWESHLMSKDLVDTLERYGANANMLVESTLKLLELEKRKFTAKDKRSISYGPLTLVGIQDYGGHCVWHRAGSSSSSSSTGPHHRSKPALLTVALCYDDELRLWCPLSCKRGAFMTPGPTQPNPWSWWWNMAGGGAGGGGGGGAG
eukprot:SAG22_NODE_1992_length_3194_cov_9.023910_1_plen_151_part_10